MAALPGWVQDTAVDLGVVAGLIVSLGVILKTRVGKAFGGFVRRTYKRAFGQPFTTWLVTSIRAAVKPEIDALSVRNDDQHAENGKRLEQIERRQAVMETNLEVVAGVVTAHGERLDTGSAAMEKIRISLSTLATDVAALRTKPAPSLPPTEVPGPSA